MGVMQSKTTALQPSNEEPKILLQTETGVIIRSPGSCDIHSHYAFNPRADPRDSAAGIATGIPTPDETSLRSSKILMVKRSAQNAKMKDKLVYVKVPPRSSF